MKNLAQALLKAQKSMVGAVKDSKNPFFKSNYADLGSVIDACMPLLHDNGILIVQPMVVLDGKQYVETRLIHVESGETISGYTLIVTKNENDAQLCGAGQTYARRFGLQSLVVLKSLDDDGNTAAGKVAVGVVKQTTPSTAGLVAPVVVTNPVVTAKAAPFKIDRSPKPAVNANDDF